MRKILAIILTLLFLLSLVACENNIMVNSETTVYGPTDSNGELTLLRDDFVSYLKTKENASDATLTYDDGKYDFAVQFSGSEMITSFGECIVDVKTTFEDYFTESEQGRLVVYLTEEERADVLFYTTEDIGDEKAGEYGILVDKRDGSRRYYPLNDVNDLVGIFPALQYVLNAESVVVDGTVSEEDMRIYNEVMGALNSQWDRPENEIFEEYAGKNNMTVEQLRALVRRVMESIS